MTQSDWALICAGSETNERYAEAGPLSKRALAIFEKALGPNHPYVGSDRRAYSDKAGG